MKIHARVDGKGRPFIFGLTPGQRHDATMAETLMQQGAIRSGKRGRPHDASLYHERNIIERFFGRLKYFRAVATRYDKRATSYLATVLLAAIVLCL